MKKLRSKEVKWLTQIMGANQLKLGWLLQFKERALKIPNLTQCFELGRFKDPTASGPPSVYNVAESQVIPCQMDHVNSNLGLGMRVLWLTLLDQLINNTEISKSKT